MGPLKVEFLYEVIESLLLLKQVAAGRLGCFEFKGAMHPLVTSVLLRGSRLDSLQLDSQAHPPDRKPR